jgi:hypothetical protein
MEFWNGAKGWTALFASRRLDHVRLAYGKRLHRQRVLRGLDSQEGCLSIDRLMPLIRESSQSPLPLVRETGPVPVPRSEADRDRMQRELLSATV